MMRVRFGLVLLAAALLASGALQAPSPATAKPAKQLFGAEAEPSEHAPQAFGGYAKGCLAGAMRLAETGPGQRWQAMRLSRGRNYGHPEMIGFIERLSEKAAIFGWGGLLVGDISQPRGGPMLTGHASHQLGLDADIWFLPGPPGRELTRQEREKISAVTMVSPDKRTLTGNWTPLHPLVLRAAAEDPKVARIFVNPAIKKRLCVDEAAAGANTAWLRVLRPWWGHHYHFHVRLHCPDGSPGCVEQAAPPAGDGCEEVDGWLTDEALFPTKPAKPRKPKPAITLADLPDACRVLIERN